MIKRFSIRKKLIVAFILIGVFPMLIATYIGVKIASVRLERGIEERINYAGKSAVYLLAKKKTELEGVAKSFADDPRLRQVLQGGVNIKFLWFDTPLKVFLFNHKGSMIFSSTDDHFPRPKHPEKGMTLLRAGGNLSPWPLLVYLFPVSDRERPIGTIMTGYVLNRKFLNDLKSVTGVESILFRQDDLNGYVQIGGKAKLALPEELFENVVVNKKQAFTRESTILRQGKEDHYYALLTPLPDAEGKVSFILLNGIPTSETLSGKLASARFYYILIVVGVLLSILAGSAVATGISWPILHFSQGVRAISAGNYNQKIHVKSKDEIGELAESFNQMTDRLKETIAELVENRNYTENILRSLLNGVITIDPGYRIMRVNRATESIFRLPGNALVGRDAREVFSKDGEILNQIQKSMTHHRKQEGIETVLHREDGSTIPVELSLSILQDPTEEKPDRKTGLVILLRDLSEIQALKEHIRRQDRLAALGELSAGIAHEIRNPLGVIKGAAGILNKGLQGQEPKFGELSSMILEEVDRLNKVIQNFLEFARPMPPVGKPHNINDLIQSTLQIASLQIKQQGVRVLERLSPDLPTVMVDEQQIHQVFLNLILNALQAVDPGDTIEISSVYLEKEGQIQVVFSDTGMGIPEENIDKVFNPFFTTKEEGTGLGLSVVSKIMENHHGKIFLTSRTGQGTRFTLIFPIMRQVEILTKKEGSSE